MEIKKVTNSRIKELKQFIEKCIIKQYEYYSNEKIKLGFGEIKFDEFKMEKKLNGNQ